jgi:site-specific recombinase XerD
MVVRCTILLCQRTMTKYPVEILTPDEARSVIYACSSQSATGIRNAALFTVLYRAGLRINEALSLHLKDVDLKAGTITVLHGKGDKRRAVGIDPAACLIVARWLERREAPRGSTVFCTLAGGKLDDSYVRRALRRAADRAGIDKRVHPHGLRHAHAAELMAEGVPANEIQGQLGHTSLQTTDIYLRHIAPQQRIDRIRQREWNAA